MKNQTSILVIDDEPLICKSCDRIFSQAGYMVDTQNDPELGFRQAFEKQYDAIVLDLKLGEKDGIELLSDLRNKNSNVPVIVITGYPSDETRSISKKLGVIDYIVKPFEPAEILKSIQKINYKSTSSNNIKEINLDVPTVITEEKKDDENYHFYKSSWFKTDQDGLCIVGGHIQNSLYYNNIHSIELPELGKIIYKGLPLAEIESKGYIQDIISPVTGKIIEINMEFLKNLSTTQNYINSRCWIAKLDPYNLQEDLKTGELREIMYFANDPNQKNDYELPIFVLGYKIIYINSFVALKNILKNNKIKVLLFNATNFLNNGPKYIQNINQEFPDIKIILTNKSNSKFEQSYREHKLFYYGINPLSYTELAEVLNCAFHKKINVSLETKAISFLPKTITKIKITNRYGKKVTLLAFDNTLENNKGLGYLLRSILVNRSYPLEITYSWDNKNFTDEIAEQAISNEKDECDHIIILHLKDLNMIPGNINIEKKYVDNSGCENIITTLSIQPAHDKNNKALFNNDVTLALADIVFNEMVSKYYYNK